MRSHSPSSLSALYISEGLANLWEQRLSDIADRVAFPRALIFAEISACLVGSYYYQEYLLFNPVCTTSWFRSIIFHWKLYRFCHVYFKPICQHDD